MCFSETQSFINVIILIIGSIYVYPKYRLTIFLIFLALKDFIQGFLYKYQHNEKLENILTVLSWIHICFQPLFVNIFMSNFSQNKNNYWNIIFIICFLYGIYTLTTLNEFDIQNDPDCIPISNNDDFCSTKTTSYIGKYHIGYKFSRDKGWLMFPIIYMILMFLPSLFTKSKILSVFYVLFYTLINVIYNKNTNTKFREYEGEKAAIWCFSSMVFFLPIAVFNKQIYKILF
tara:strand:+ start:31 stop:723 length:693 start_codon:yes stop_codon:yes gene_type:complete